MAFIDDVELSVRAYGVLNKAYPNLDMDTFMALDKNTVMQLPNAGRRTWQEVADIQTQFKHIALQAVSKYEIAVTFIQYPNEPMYFLAKGYNISDTKIEVNRVDGSGFIAMLHNVLHVNIIPLN